MLNNYGTSISVILETFTAMKCHQKKAKIIYLVNKKIQYSYTDKTVFEVMYVNILDIIHCPSFLKHYVSETDPVSEMLCFKNTRMMDNVQNINIHNCNSPSSESFRCILYLRVMLWTIYILQNIVV
jgi:hypothetical protein